MPAFRLLALALLVVPPAALSAVDEAGQACIDALNRAGVAVARAQAALNDACLASDADPAACLANDADPDLAAAVQATFDAAVASCGEPPAFGVARTFDQAVTDAATTHVRRLVEDALGASPAGAFIAPSADRKGNRCQAAVVKGTGAIVTGYLARFERCVAKALDRGAGDASALATCAASSAKATAKVRKRLAAQARRRCRGQAPTEVLPGPCAGAGTAAATARCLGARAVCRACRIADAFGALDADCDLVDDGTANASCRFLVTLEGDAIPFHDGPDGRVAGATISLVEHPDRVVTTGPDGHFAFDGLEEGSEVTVTMSHPDYHAIQTGTFRLGPRGVDRVTFQAVIHDIYAALATLLDVVPDDANRCQMVTTVTRVGKSIYDPGAHGEEGVTVTLDPPLPAEHGPIYFNSSVLPDRTLTETSDDGGVLFIQVPPGDYVWTARKSGAVFSRVKMKCRVGFLVNASPPRGLQRH